MLVHFTLVTSGALSPVMMKIELADIPARIQQREAARGRKPAWYKATDEDKHQYTTLLEEKLQDIAFPDSYSCRDVNCKMEEHSNQCNGQQISLCSQEGKAPGRDDQV